MSAGKGRRVDQRLVERARRGDRNAYEELARASADRLYAVAYQIIADDEGGPRNAVDLLTVAP